MAERRAHKRTVGSHLGDPGGEVVAVLVAILCEPRGEELLEAGKSACREHLHAQRVLLELRDVPHEIALGAGIGLASSEGGSDGFADGVLATGTGQRAIFRGLGDDLCGLGDGVTLDLDGRHGDRRCDRMSYRVENVANLCRSAESVA